MTRAALVIGVTTALILAFFGFAAGGRAQDDPDDFDDLQATAEALAEGLEAQQTEIDDLAATAEAQQAEIDALREERVAAGEPTVAQATPVGPADLTPGSEAVLYEADTTGGLDQWTGSEDWLHRDGQLVNDGSAIGFIAAPYEPGSVRDYAVEAEILLVRCPEPGYEDLDLDEDDTPGGSGGFGIVARAEERGSYWAGWNCREPRSPNAAGIWAAEPECCTFETLAEQEYSVNADWHTYRMEVQGDTIRLLVDGELLVETRDLRFVEGGQIGLWSSQTQINVRSFRVFAL